MGAWHRFLCKVIRLQQPGRIAQGAIFTNLYCFTALELQRRQGVANKIMVVRCGIFSRELKFGTHTSLSWHALKPSDEIETRKSTSTASAISVPKKSRLFPNYTQSVTLCVFLSPYVKFCSFILLINCRVWKCCILLHTEPEQVQKSAKTSSQQYINCSIVFSSSLYNYRQVSFLRKKQKMYMEVSLCRVYQIRCLHNSVNQGSHPIIELCGETNRRDIA